MYIHAGCVAHRYPLDTPPNRKTYNEIKPAMQINPTMQINPILINYKADAHVSPVFCSLRAHPAGAVSATVVLPDPVTVAGALEGTNFILEPPGILRNVSTPVGKRVQVLSYDQPADGCANVTVWPLGGLELMPAANFWGACSFNATTSDGNNGSIKTTVVVQIGEPCGAGG